MEPHRPHVNDPYTICGLPSEGVPLWLARSGGGTFVHMYGGNVYTGMHVHSM